MGKSLIIEKLLSKEENVKKVRDWVSSQEEIQEARCAYTKEELVEILMSLPREHFDAMMNQLNVDYISPSPPPSLVEGHLQPHLLDIKDDSLPGFNEQPADCGNFPVLPDEPPKSESKCVDCFEKNQVVSKLKARCQLLEKEKQELQIKCQEFQKKQAASDEMNTKSQILEKNGNLMVKQQVKTMGSKIEELKWKKAQIENTLKVLQEESKENDEEHLSIIHSFHQKLFERSKKIEELEAKVQLLENTNPGNDDPEFYMRAKKMEEELSRLDLKTKRNSELLGYAIAKKSELEQECQGLKNENQKLKEDLKKKDDTLQMQQASQAALYVSREAELARRVNQEVHNLHRVYQELINFARRRGYEIQGICDLNDESAE